MELPTYFVRYPDPEVRTRAAAIRGISEDAVTEEEGWGHAEFEDRSAAHDFADQHGGFVFARRDIRVISSSSAPGKAWSYVPVHLPHRPERGEPLPTEE
jgi:hypothetical protein